jgi:DNA-binding NarL/FixJ family response regulator
MQAISISIIEDNTAVRKGLERIVQETDGFLCLSSYDNAEDAMKELPGIQPDIVIVDIQLPGASGIDCVRQLKAAFPRMQFMMFTIYEDSEQVFEALTAGATGYLLKNTSPDKIPDALRELYAGGSPMTTGIARRVVTSFQKQPAQEAVNELSSRENEVLQLLSKGFLYKEIAARLQISIGTVRQHIHNIYGKLQVQNKTEAINKAYRK